MSHTSQRHTLSAHDTQTACKHISKTNLVSREEKKNMKIVKYFYQLLKNNCCQAAGLVNLKKKK